MPGHIIAIPDHGSLKIGDALEGEPVGITDIPNFAAQILGRIKVDDPMKSNHAAYSGHTRRALPVRSDAGLRRSCNALPLRSNNRR
jgi:hypothetical protein